MIPKYPDSVQWFLIDGHFSKQWSDYNYDQGPRGTCKEQDLLFQIIIKIINYIYIALNTMFLNALQ